MIIARITQKFFEIFEGKCKQYFFENMSKFFWNFPQNFTNVFKILLKILSKLKNFFFFKTSRTFSVWIIIIKKYTYFVNILHKK